MAGNPEILQKQNGAIDTGLDAWQKFNKLTLAAELGVAIFVPALAVPALALAAVDGVQIIAINEWQKSRKKAANNNEPNQLKSDNVVQHEVFKRKKEIKERYRINREVARKAV